MGTQLILMLVTLAVIAALAFGMNKSIKKYEANKHKMKKKKGRTKYMPESKNPGK